MATGAIIGQSTSNLLPLDGSKPMTGNLNMGSKKITNVANGSNTNDAVNYGQLTTSSVAASRITGTLSTSNIPNLDASKITSGQFNTARIPNLSASKITSGVLSVANGGTGVSSLDALLTGLGVHNYVYGDYDGGNITNLPFAPRFLVLCGRVSVRLGSATTSVYGSMVAAKPSTKNSITTIFIGVESSNYTSYPSSVFAQTVSVTFNSDNIEIDGVQPDGSYFVF